MADSFKDNFAAVIDLLAALYFQADTFNDEEIRENVKKVLNLTAENLTTLRDVLDRHQLLDQPADLRLINEDHPKEWVL